jgi:hypothetical protein
MLAWVGWPRLYAAARQFAVLGFDLLLLADRTPAAA